MQPEDRPRIQIGPLRPALPRVPKRFLIGRPPSDPDRMTGLSTVVKRLMARPALAYWMVRRSVEPLMRRPGRN